MSNRCYARALPTDGSHGGQAWGPTNSFAESRAMDACRMYSAQTGGNPQTCRIVESHCNDSYCTIARLLPDDLTSFNLSTEKKGRFTEIALKLDAGKQLSSEEKDEFDELSLKIGAHRQIEETKDGKKKTCVWICNNGFMCDPEFPPPNCNCHKVCY